MQTLTSLEAISLRPIDHWGEVQPVLESQLTQPGMIYQPFVERRKLNEFLLLRAAQTLHSREAISVLAQVDGVVCGLSCWSTLAWDSKMYGFPAAKLDFLLASGEDAEEIKRSLLDETIEGARNMRIRHLIARADADDHSTMRVLEESKFEIIDGIQTLSLRLPANLNGWHDSDNAPETRLFEEGDLAKVLEIARSSYVFDRFHTDSAIAKATADRINEAWLANSCNGNAADAVLVAVDGPVVLGYATCKIDRETREGLGVSFGTIVMVATTANARNRGVGQACTAAAIRWFQNQNVDVVLVGTQLRNIPAARLYEKCGFRTISNTVTLRKVL